VNELILWKVAGRKRLPTPSVSFRDGEKCGLALGFAGVYARSQFSEPIHAPWSTLGRLGEPTYSSLGGSLIPDGR
jgi:hypothetical protein